MSVIKTKLNSPDEVSVSANVQRDHPHPPVKDSQSYPLRSRRNLLVGSVGAAGALGALEMLNATEARADDPAYRPHDGTNIDLSLVNSLRFNRKNSENPAIAFSPNGLLVGFGPNLLLCKNDSSSTCRLYSEGRQVLKITGTNDVPDFIPKLTVGTKGTATQIIKDFAGNTLTSKITIESIDDVPDDFLLTGVTQSAIYTGAFFEITTDVTGPDGHVGTSKTTYNALTNSFPLGVLVSPGNSGAGIDPEVQGLASIAAEIIQTKFAAALAILPTDLQQDFSWKKLFTKIAVVHIAICIVAFVATAVFDTKVLAGITAAAFAGAVVFAFAAGIAGIFEEQSG